MTMTPGTPFIRVWLNPADEVRKRGVDDTEIPETLRAFKTLSSYNKEPSGGDAPLGTAIVEEAAPDRTYPHLYDTRAASGAAQMLIASALRDAEAALSSFADADFQSVGSSLATIAVALGEAHKHTQFNESFGAAVSFVRRAALSADPSDVSRQALNALINSLQALQKNPTLDLEECGELTDSLTREGWNGELGSVDALVSLLLDGDEEEINHQQDFFLSDR